MKPLTGSSVATLVLLNTGNNAVAGFVGANFLFSDPQRNGTIQNCYSTGTVSADSMGAGLVGDDSTTGTVTSSYYLSP